MILKTAVLAEGFLFPEGPRWHEGKLWMSDMQSRLGEDRRPQRKYGKNSGGPGFTLRTGLAPRRPAAGGLHDRSPPAAARPGKD